MDWKLFRIQLYEWTCVLRVPALLTALALLGTSVWFLASSFGGKRSDIVMAVAGLLLCVLSLYGLLFLGWFFPTFRLVRWWMTRHFFQAVRWLSRPGFALSALAVVLLVYTGYETIQTVRGVKPVVSALEASHPQADLPIWVDLLAMVALLTLVREMSRARRRIIVQPFVSYTKNSAGPEENPAHGKALADLLRSEIAGITALYQVIDEIQPKNPRVEATVSVENIGDTLKEAITSTSNVKAFGVDIPLGSLITMFGWLVRGPRLTGSLLLQGDANRRVLVADITGGGLSGSWRVHEEDLLSEDRDIDAGPPSENVVLPIEARLIRQMAFRIVTRLLNVGSPRWQAVLHYTEGLRYYRETQRTERDKILNLCKAERAFIRALGCDKSFSQCHYNLGIVYDELERQDSAEAAFRRAMEEDPLSFDAAYGQAQERFDRGRYGSAVDFCETAIRIRPEDARAWNLKGWALRKDREEGKPPRSGAVSQSLAGLLGPWQGAWQIGKEDPSRPLPPEGWSDIRVVREVAAALAWRDLCRWLRKSDDPKQQAWIATACTINSGIAYSLTGRQWRATQRFWHALHLGDDRPELRLEMGKARCQAGRWKAAARILNPVNGYLLGKRDQLELLLYRTAANDALDLDSRQASFDCLRLMDLAVFFKEDREFLLSSTIGAQIVRRNLLTRKAGSWLDYLELAQHLLLRLEKGEKEDSATYRGRLSAIIDIWKAYDESKRDSYYAGDRQAHNLRVKALQKQMRIRFRDEGLGFPAIPSGCAPVPLTWQPWKRSRKQRRPADFQRMYELMEKEKLGNFSWSWMVTVARILLAEDLLRSPGSASADEAGLAVEMLQDAIKSLTEEKEHRRDFLVRKRHLHDLLAQAHELISDTGAGDRGTLLTALQDAKQAVLIEPQGAEERRMLGRVYALLEDFEQASDELRTSWQLHPASEVLQEMAVTGWQYGSSRINPKSRQGELARLADVLNKALDITEDSEESSAKHGMAHFWLGRFRGELRETDQAVYNLRIARSLGYKPIETALVLGWVFLESGAFGEAEETFHAGMTEARRLLRRSEQGRGPGKSWVEARREASLRPARAAGEERSVNELLAELLLGWALAIAERKGDLNRARHLATIARSRIGAVRGAPLQRSLRALHAEVVGWIFFRERRWAESLRYLSRSTELQASPSAYYRLGAIHLEKARRETDSTTRNDGLDLATEAFEISRTLDRRELFLSRIKDLEASVERERKGSNPGPVTLPFIAAPKSAA